MKITVYTTSTCPFCKQVKEYLASNNLQFEEKNLEENRENLKEMLKVSDNFSGVPFTVIVKDDGTEAKLKGFTKSEYDKALGVGEKPSAAPNGTSSKDASSKLQGIMGDLAAKSAPTASPPAPSTPPAEPKIPPSSPKTPPPPPKAPPSPLRSPGPSMGSTQPKPPGQLGGTTPPQPPSPSTPAPASPTGSSTSGTPSGGAAADLPEIPDFPKK